jgi:hypothetical protein
MKELTLRVYRERASLRTSYRLLGFSIPCFAMDLKSRHRSLPSKEMFWNWTKCAVLRLKRKEGFGLGWFYICGFVRLLLV